MMADRRGRGNRCRVAAARCDIPPEAERRRSPGARRGVITMAQVDYFLKIDGIEGESDDAAFAKQIQIESWSWGETNAGGFAHGSGGGAGKVSMQDLNVTMKVNKASPSLAQACATGQHIKSAELVARKAGDKPQVFLKVKLTDVLCSSYQTGGSGRGDVVPVDQVTLNFGAIEIDYGQQDAKGKVNALDQKMGYDLRKMKKI
jgi:type VI secretion system secreted protein Hcp